MPDLRSSVPLRPLHDLDLHEVLADVCVLVSARARRRGLEFALSIAGDVPARVRGDEPRLRDILLHLIGEAVAFARDGEVVVWVDGGHPGVRFEVVANGRARGLTALFASSYDAPEPERGLPHLDGLKVLLAEDHATGRGILFDRLRRWGLCPTGVADGAAALDALYDAARDGEPFDLALLDHDLRLLDAPAIVRRLAAAPALADLPVVFLTAGECGTPDALAVAKPVRASALREAIDAAMQRRREHSHPVVLDPAVLDELRGCEGGRLLVSLVTELFAEHGTSTLVAIGAALAVEDAAAVAHASHRLAGAAETVGAITVGTLARRLETDGLGRAARELPRLRCAFLRTCEKLGVADRAL